MSVSARGKANAVRNEIIRARIIEVLAQKTLELTVQLATENRKYCGYSAGFCDGYQLAMQDFEQIPHGKQLYAENAIEEMLDIFRENDEEIQFAKPSAFCRANPNALHGYTAGYAVGYHSAVLDAAAAVPDFAALVCKSAVEMAAQHFA